MKTTDIPYYIKFVFSSLDGELCLTTTDLEVLKQIKSVKDGEIKRSYTIGDEIYFDSEEERNQKLKVTDVRIRRLCDDTKHVLLVFDLSDCEHSGNWHEPLFIIHITIEKV